MIFRRPWAATDHGLRQRVLLDDGSEELIRLLGDRLGVGLGETTADGRFTLLPVVCLGACDKAPAMLIDWQLHGPVSTDGLSSILALYP